jgi:hopene-associated glycosyltransferase HpnB
MASLHMHSFWEKLLMPAFIYFFKMLYPFVLANSPNRRFYSAAGGCILLETSLFAAIGGLESIRGAVIDDCTLAARVKKRGFRTWIGQSRSVSSIRPYQGLSEIWNMVARSAYNQLRYSPLVLALCVFGLLTLFIAPFCGLLIPDTAARLLGLSAYALMIASYIPTLRFYSLNPAWALLLPLSGVLYLGMTLSSALRYYRGERTRWKGRIYQTTKT